MKHVPMGFTTQQADTMLPAGLTFLGRTFSEATLIKLAYAYEQATHHRLPPPNFGPLPWFQAPCRRPAKEPGMRAATQHQARSVPL